MAVHEVGREEDVGVGHALITLLRWLDDREYREEAVDYFDDKASSLTVTATATQTGEADSLGYDRAGSTRGLPGPWDAEAAAAALSDSVPCGVLLFGPGGELRGVNGQFAEILGCEQGELAALDCFEGYRRTIGMRFRRTARDGLAMAGAAAAGRGLLG